MSARNSKKVKYKPFQQINVEERLKELFDGKICYKCGAPAKRLRSIKNIIPKNPGPEYYFCHICISPRNRSKSLRWQWLDRYVPYYTPEEEDDEFDFEGADPWVCLEPGTKEMQSLYKQEDDENFEEDIHSRSGGAEYGEYRPLWQTGGKFNHRDFTFARKQYPTGTGVYVQIGAKVYPWMAYER